MDEKKSKRAVSSEYYVTVQFGIEKLENCIMKMLKDKENKMKICNSSK